MPGEYPGNAAKGLEGDETPPDRNLWKSHQRDTSVGRPQVLSAEPAHAEGALSALCEVGPCERCSRTPVPVNRGTSRFSNPCIVRTEWG